MRDMKDMKDVLKELVVGELNDDYTSLFNPKDFSMDNVFEIVIGSTIYTGATLLLGASTLLGTYLCKEFFEMPSMISKAFAIVGGATTVINGGALTLYTGKHVLYGLVHTAKGIAYLAVALPTRRIKDQYKKQQEEQKEDIDTIKTIQEAPNELVEMPKVKILKR